MTLVLRLYLSFFKIILDILGPILVCLKFSVEKNFSRNCPLGIRARILLPVAFLVPRTVPGTEQVLSKDFLRHEREGSAGRAPSQHAVRGLGEAFRKRPRRRHDCFAKLFGGVCKHWMCTYPTTQQFRPSVLIQRNENVSTKTLCKNIHGSFIDVSSQLEMTQMFINTVMAIRCGIFIQWNTAQQ